MTAPSLTHNLGWKLLSLLVAGGLWFALVDDPELTTTIVVPVQYKRLPAGLDISSEVPPTVQLEIRGPQSKLSAVSESRTPAVLDLSDEHQPGERTFTITEKNVELAAGVTLARAIPSQLRLRLERRVTREVPVQVRFSSQPPAGYRLAWMEASPAKVRVEGPESHVNRVESVETDPVELHSVVSAAEFRVNPYVADPQVRFPALVPITIRVRAERTR